MQLKPQCSGYLRLRNLVAQLDVPICQIDKVPPTLVVLGRESDVDKRPPLRTFRSPDQRHMRFVWEPISLSRITRDTRADYIFPGCQAASITRQYMVEIELGPIENRSAILAGIFVPLENVVPGEFHFLLRQSIKEQEDDHLWHTDLPRNRCDHFMVGSGGGEITPAIKVVGQEIILRI